LDEVWPGLSLILILILDPDPCLDELLALNGMRLYTQASLVYPVSLILILILILDP